MTSTTAADPADLAARFADAVRGDAAAWDARGELPADVRRALARDGLLGADLPPCHGGLGAAPEQLGEVCARLGGVCGSLRALVTVQGMVGAALLRWGTAGQRERWLPALARGELTAAFAATEAAAGSDLGAVTTAVERDGDTYTVSGEKRWITFGEVADVFLVLGRTDGRTAAVLVEADRPGVRREPVRGQLGLRAAQLAHVRFDAVRVPSENAVAPPGFGLSHVAGTALDHGRFTVAWGCVGMAEACLRAAAEHAVRRAQGGVVLAEHQQVRSLLGRAVVDGRAARELCLRAARLRAAGDPDAVAETVAAKYAAARAATSVAGSAVQVLGAAGCAPDSLVGRCYRDAKVMEIIEGSAQVSELHIADHLLRAHGHRAAPRRPEREGDHR
ncbi:acyl-CoA dehydrogenase family protein [Streptomyces spectabilis]|uniref:Acyl-CoA dehydrogenase n=1 Tax=Streptomyces spectabilis TaxID=68270 RepID=A0A5P2WZC6_STRST|nr:acyl-CoA dehydrogenase family protein [Streptomyces spectabilis]MBB5101378.1 alkylation response protein AidB-like acyl-CoA dehydrogenase [Streptomyces spectabilis]MCI3900574.1 acyl-CoA dehydrogenase family protein [Streptomyces spectabilis]QEV58137.1 acyl-CoA dehydrogenase [Streptomyces spectabilis]GGV11009.1 acyl-CoA dehydrogenase [Streptomyces spectabilis]